MQGGVWKTGDSCVLGTLRAGWGYCCQGSHGYIARQSEIQLVSRSRKRSNVPF